MNILFVIVHHWNLMVPAHQSLRPNPNPRIAALKVRSISFAVWAKSIHIPYEGPSCLSNKFDFKT